MPHRFLYIACQWIAAVSVLGWLAWVWMWYVAPRTPDVTHTIPENNHGTIIYFTPFEAIWGPACWIVGACAAIAGNSLKKADEKRPKSKFFL
jgi:hypothetical protein